MIGSRVDPLAAAAQFGVDVDNLTRSAAELARVFAVRRSFGEKDDHGRPALYRDQERLVVLLGQIVVLGKEARKRADRMAVGEAE